MARGYTARCIQILGGIAESSEDDGARVRAVGLLLDRGWGRAPQPHTGADGEDIRVTIRTIVEGVKGPKK